MIARLSGKIVHIEDAKVIVDVQGVGYLVQCSATTISQFAPQQSAVLYIETQVRQDHIQLFGFASLEEQQWFNKLSSVQGVGGKVALALLSTLTPQMLYEAIAAEEKKLLTQAPGVGAKVAARIINELKDKVPAMFSVKAQSGVIASMPAVEENNTMAEAVSALTNLGYERLETFRILRQILEESPDMKSSALIAAALKEFGRNS